MNRCGLAVFGQRSRRRSSHSFDVDLPDRDDNGAMFGYAGSGANRSAHPMARVVGPVRVRHERLRTAGATSPTQPAPQLRNLARSTSTKDDMHRLGPVAG